jgi:DMSO/TMAO reductase YedYZ heme-binding membrane subunit
LNTLNETGQIIGGHVRKNAAGPIIGTVLIFGLAYALLRHHVAGAVPWDEVSVRTLNKGISFGAFVLIACSFSFKPLVHVGIKLPDTWFNARKALCMTGFLLVLIHSLLSLVLFNPTVFPGSFEPDGTLTLLAGLSVLCGILAVVMLSAYNLSFQTFLREDRRFDRFTTSRKFLQFALLLAAAHLLMLGYAEWLAPGEWQGGMPPISLLAFLVFIPGILFNLLGGE